MFSSFSNRMTTYFVALFIAALGILFFLWYCGWAFIDLRGASYEQLDNAIQLLEVKADVQRNAIVTELKKRRDDIFLIVESEEIAQFVENKNANIQGNLQRLLQKQFDRLQRAYPDRFQNLLIVNPNNNLILASTNYNQIQKHFVDDALLQKAASLGSGELVERLEGENGQRLLVITHQIRTGNKLHAIFIAVLDLNIFLKDSFQPENSPQIRHGMSVLFDHAGNLLASFPKTDDPTTVFEPSEKNLASVDGSELQKNALGEELIVVHRTLKISEAHPWTLVHFSKKTQMLSGLISSVNTLLVAGLLITLLALVLISVAARRLTRPLARLTNSAMQLGDGELSARAYTNNKDTQEIVALSNAFNRMAERIHHAQRTLEAKVMHRTAALQRSEARHLTLFNATVDAVIVIDQHGIIDCNPAAVSMFGAKERTELFVKYPNALSPKYQRSGEESACAAKEHIRQAKELGHHAFDWIHQRIDNGECFDAEVMLSYVEIDGQQLLQATIRDITERKRVEAALYESEKRHRTLVEWSPECITVHRKGYIVYANTAALQALNASSLEQIIGQPIINILHPDFHSVIRKRATSIAEDGVRTSMDEIKFIRLDGRVIDVAAQGTLIDFGGTPAVYVAWHDITEEKRSAQAQRIAATAFEAQEGMFVADAQWNIVKINQSFHQVTGYSMEELQGRVPNFLEGDHQTAEFYATLRSSIETDGAWQGEVLDRRKNGQIYPGWLNISGVRDDSGVITHYVGIFVDISLRKAAEEEIRSLAFYDPLTHLPNRRLLMDRLEQALAAGTRHQRKGALLFIDLDNFKTLNDTLGHDQGDLLLQQVAERLSRCTRDGDTVARLGGDEFVVMLENLDENPIEAAAQAEIVGIKILTELNQTYRLGVNEHHSTPSIGVTLFGDAQETIAEPLKRADLAMYQAKGAGRNTLCFFDPRMQIVVTERAQLEENLREAMLSDQFQLHYQAQMTQDKRLFGAEVLIRWSHPQRGMVSPADFIPLAEETGLISILGYWVLHTACNQLAAWAMQPSLADLTIAVNVSPSQFHQNNFVEQVLDVLELTGANPKRLKLELTEGFSISNIEDVIIKMERLKKEGVGFSLDDFGTGYSSLSYLKRLPLAQLKIDQSFVRDILIDPNDAAISKMVIVLADSLGLLAIAEGVETEEQKNFLASQGCHAYQGYLFSRPLPIDQFETLARDLVTMAL